MAAVVTTDDIVDVVVEALDREGLIWRPVGQLGDSRTLAKIAFAKALAAPGIKELCVKFMEQNAQTSYMDYIDDKLLTTAASILGGLVSRPGVYGLNSDETLTESAVTLAAKLLVQTQTHIATTRAAMASTSDELEKALDGGPNDSVG